MAYDTTDELTEAEVEDEFDPTASEESDEYIDLQAIVTAAIDDAVDYIDSEVAPAREEALQYYRGDPFGDEEEGRSQFVSRDVHDTVKALLPSLLRTFFGAQNVVEFMPEGPEDVAAAEQATDYVNWIVTRDNPGFLVVHNALKDALIQRTGIIKYWWDESESVEEEEYTDLDELTVALLMEDESLEIVEETVRLRQDEEGQPLASFTVRRRRTKGRVRLDALPPEEFVIDRRARSLDTATVVAHRCEKSLSALVALGYPEDVIREYLGDDTLTSNTERVNRTPAIEQAGNGSDETQRTALYTEAFIRADVDGDGIAELTKFCCIGSGYEILAKEPATEAPFADFCPDPEPHTFIGSSTTDQVKDIQRFKSNAIRKMNDSLAQSIHPRTVVVEGQANLDDVLNNETGAIIRARREGAVQPLTTPFVGQAAFPVLEYMDQVKQARTGIHDATQGLDSDAMQSSTRLAVQATVEAAQQQLELVARVFLETGFRRLYRGILGLVKRHQDKARVLRLRGQWVEMDPRSWNEGMDTQINTALGTGTNDEKLQRISAVEQLQRGILTELGVNNPLVTLGQYSHTLGKMVELAGFRDSSQFFNALPADWTPPPTPPQKTPEEMLAEVQMEEIRANIQKKAADLAIEREKMLRNDDRERDRTEADIALRAAEIEGKHGIAVNLADIMDMVNRQRPGDEFQ